MLNIKARAYMHFQEKISQENNWVAGAVLGVAKVPSIHRSFFQTAPPKL